MHACMTTAVNYGDVLIDVLMSNDLIMASDCQSSSQASRNALLPFIIRKSTPKFSSNIQICFPKWYHNNWNMLSVVIPQSSPFTTGSRAHASSFSCSVRAAAQLETEEFVEKSNYLLLDIKYILFFVLYKIYTVHASCLHLGWCWWWNHEAEIWKCIKAFSEEQL